MLLLVLAGGAARGQSALDLYGVLDAGVVRHGGCANCATGALSAGIASPSLLGIRGREALGERVAAVFTLEAGLLNDTGEPDQNGRLFGRLAYIGLDGRLGALTLGRQDNPQYLSLTDVADPFKGGMAGNAGNLMGYTVKRYDNTIKYATPPLRGIHASAIYSFGESPYSSAANRAWGAMLGYAKGPLNVSVAHQRKDNIIAGNGGAATLDTSARNTLVAANVNLGHATVFAAYGVNKGQGSSPWDPANPYGALALALGSGDSRDVLLGVALPFGRATYLASYIRKDDREAANRDARQIAVGLTYTLSRRTDFYAAYAKIRNSNGAGYTVGNASDAGRGSAAFNIGLRHSF
ncbi:porin [Janthinobacterium fluminis]|uniref:porin n=1 Tax=Janthinobacterium fluminis TaxID=2987524 RepID=UPI00307AA5D9